MTNQAKPDAAAHPELGFLFDRKELLAIRVRPAEFARLLGVSKQTVSVWIRDGKVTANALDGLLDVRRAIQDVLRNTDPGRLRSRVLRQAVTDALELRENLARAEDRAEAAEAALRERVSKIEFLEKWSTDADRSLEIFQRLIVEQADRLREASADEWPAILQELSDAADLEVNPLDDDDLADFINAVEAPRDLSTQEGGGAD